MKNVALIFFGLFVVAHGRTIDTSAVYKPRIWNGENAKLGERPYQVSLQSYNSHFCGGIILNEYWIITAAHCVEGKSHSSIRVVAGTISLKEPYSSHQSERIITHDKYTPTDSYVNDIALVKVSKAFEFSKRIQPVILPEAHAKVKTNSSVVVSGWGYLSNWSTPDILQKAQIYILDPEACQAAVQAKGYNVYPTQICATYPPMNKGDCNGDSGGPLTVDNVLAGIVSWSFKDLGCASPVYPSVYTRASEYVDWIKEHAK